MTEILSLIIPVLLFAVLLNVAPASAADLSLITWTNSLATEKQLDAYLTGTDRMARETISLDATKKEVVMGSSPSGELRLSKCLEMMKMRRAGHGVYLEVPSLKVFLQAVESFKKYAAECWITLSIRCFKGPLGAEPTFHPWQSTDVLLNLPSSSLHISFGMTIGYGGSEKGYSHEVLLRLAEDWRNGSFDKFPVFDFSIDIFHISHTTPLYLERVYQYLRLVRRVDLITTEEMQDKVQMPAFREFLERLDVDERYFDVPLKFRKAFFGAGGVDGIGVGSAGRRVWGIADGMMMAWGVMGCVGWMVWDGML